ncbi:hypothetical protein AB1Y20_023615 [Prymnesium parvum]|uniref:Amino acid transporter transmembrane domain-containing protein n=1 Tax=Prymnesium parvum TaxID=97485 RepID=A0AB34JF93_PRYPA
MASSSDASLRESPTAAMLEDTKLQLAPDELDDESPHVRRSTWWMSSMILTGEILGTGVLGLPYACAQLGWVLGMISCIFFCCTSVYSGVLLSAVKNEMYPAATSYLHVAQEVGGPGFALFTRVAILATWAALLPYYLITCIKTLSGIFPNAGFCPYQWSFIVAACLVPLLQLRSLHMISYLCLASTVAMAVAVVIFLSSLISMQIDAHDGANHSHVETDLWPPDPNFLDVYRNTGSFIFAYQGQSMFLEIIREMRQPRHFPRSVFFANMITMTVYTSTVVLAYASKGTQVNQFLPDMLDDSPVNNIARMLLFFHVLIAYLITGQPLHRSYHLIVSSSTANDPGRRGAWHWFLITSAQLIAGVLVANAVPFFEAVQGLLGSMTGAPIVFGWPAFFFLRGSYLHGRKVAAGHWLVCGVYLCVFLPLFTVLGTINSMTDIVQQISTSGPPFSCNASSA